MSTQIQETSEPATLLEELRRDGIELWADGKELRYRAPAGVLTESRKAAVRERKLELITLLSEGSRPTSRAPVADDAEAVWVPTDCQFGFAADPQPHHFHRIVRMSQALDVPALEAAVNYLVRRHSILRTRYLADTEGRLWAATERERHIRIGFTDLQSVSEDRRESIAREIAVAATREPFDVETGPMLRLNVLQLASEELALVFVAHHSVFDGWSATIWASEFAVAYTAFSAGREPVLPRLKLEFRDFAAQQLALLTGPAGDAHLNYWREKFRGASRAGWLPKDRCTPPDPSVDVPPVRHRLSAAAADFLRDFSRTGETTLFVTMLTLYGTVLRRWSGFDDLFMWVSHTGRPRAELHGLIGCFFDVWPLRMDLSGDPRFTEALERVRQTYVESLPHIGVTPLMLASELNSIRGGRHIPSVIFNYLPDSAAVESTVSAPRETRRTMTLLDWVPPSGRFALGSPHAISISPFERGQGFGWSFQHSGELFEDATIERVSSALAGAIDVLASHPHARLDELVPHGIAGPGAVSFDPVVPPSIARKAWWRFRPRSLERKTQPA